MEKEKKIKISKKSREKRKREKKNQLRSRAKLLYSFCGKRMMKGGDKDEYQSSFPPHRCSISSVNAIQNAGIRLADRERENGGDTCFTTSLLRGAKFRATLSSLYNVDPDPTEQTEGGVFAARDSIRQSSTTTLASSFCFPFR